MIKGNILKKYKKAKITKIQIILLRSCMICFAIILFGGLISMINYRIIQNSYKGEKIYQQNINTLTARNIAVVPGTAVSEDTPNAKCKERLDTAELLYKKKLVTAILVSGTKKETNVMCRYLLSHKIPEKCILRDAAGVSSYETITRAAEKLSGKTIYFCTQELYAARSQFFMNRAKLNGKVVCVDTMFYSHPWKTFLREYFADSKAILNVLIYHGNSKQSTKTVGFAKLPSEMTTNTKYHIQAQSQSVPDDYRVTDSNPKDYYDVEKAVEYARTYALKRNPDYPAFENNCTNFVSQCLAAGGISMTGKETISNTKRLKVSKKSTDWYSVSKQDSKKIKHYGTSSAFINTDDFLKYFQEELGYTLSTFDNTYEGKLKCYQTMASGDVVVLYDSDGSIAHIGLISGMGDMNAYYCANTNDRLDYGVFNINSTMYPRFGILHMSKQ